MNAEGKIVGMDSVQDCLNCGERMRPTRADLVFEQDDLVITVKDVPVSYCDACGEQYVPGPIGLAISDAVDRVVRDARREREAGLHYVAREVVLRECPMALRDRV